MGRAGGSESKRWLRREGRAVVGRKREMERGETRKGKKNKGQIRREGENNVGKKGRKRSKEPKKGGREERGE